MAFSRTEPPSFDPKGKPTPQTKVGVFYLIDEATRSRLLLLLNGKLYFDFWMIIGDDFDVTRGMVEAFPTPSQVDAVAVKRLVGELDAAMKANVSFKLNAGKRVGNYNLARCRRVTDKADALFAPAMGLDKVMEEIELLHGQVVRTDFGVGDEAEADAAYP